jgi:hypothetical protein
LLLAGDPELVQPEGQVVAHAVSAMSCWMTATSRPAARAARCWA